MLLLPRGVSAATTGGAKAAAAADTAAAIGIRGMDGLGAAAAADAAGCWADGLPAAHPGVAAAGLGSEVMGTAVVVLLTLLDALLPSPPGGALLLLVPKPRAGAGSGKGPAGMPKGGGAVVALMGGGPMLTDGAAAAAPADEKARAELAALPAGVQKEAGWEAAVAAAARVPKVTPVTPAKPGPAPEDCGCPVGGVTSACWPPPKTACQLLVTG